MKTLNLSMLFLLFFGSGSVAIADDKGAFQFRSFANTETAKLVKFVNDLNAGPDDVEGAVFVRNNGVSAFYVWARRGMTTGGSWVIDYSSINNDLIEDIGGDLDAGTRIVLGIGAGVNEPQLWWLSWRKDP